MAEQRYRVTVERTNESRFQSQDVTFEATAAQISDEGGLSFKTEQGERLFAAGTWGELHLVRTFRS